jgi:cytochrome bd-type quinol oxidase subunit 2
VCARRRIYLYICMRARILCVCFVTKTWCGGMAVCAHARMHRSLFQSTKYNKIQHKDHQCAMRRMCVCVWVRLLCVHAHVLAMHTLHRRAVIRHTIEIWLILPVVICLFQGLSHACLRITAFAGICAWLITSDVICRKNLAVSAKLDNLAKRQANT